MSYSVILNSNGDDAKNITATRDLLMNLSAAIKEDHSRGSSLKFSVEQIDDLCQWSDKLVRLMNVVVPQEDYILEPADLD